MTSATSTYGGQVGDNNYAPGSRMKFVNTKDLFRLLKNYVFSGEGVEFVTPSEKNNPFGLKSLAPETLPKLEQEGKAITYTPQEGYGTFVTGLVTDKEGNIIPDKKGNVQTQGAGIAISKLTEIGGDAFVQKLKESGLVEEVEPAEGHPVAEVRLKPNTDLGLNADEKREIVRKIVKSLNGSDAQADQVWTILQQSQVLGELGTTVVLEGHDKDEKRASAAITGHVFNWKKFLKSKPYGGLYALLAAAAMSMEKKTVNLDVLNAYGVKAGEEFASIVGMDGKSASSLGTVSIQQRVKGILINIPTNVSIISMFKDKSGKVETMLASKIEVLGDIPEGFVTESGILYNTVKGEIVNGEQTYVKTDKSADFRFVSKVVLNRGDVLAAMGGNSSVQSLYTMPMKLRSNANNPTGNTRVVEVPALSMSVDTDGKWHPMLAGKIHVSLSQGLDEINPGFIELGGRAWGMKKTDNPEVVDGKTVDTYTKTNDYADLKYTSQVKLRNGDVLAAMGGNNVAQSLYTIPVQQVVNADGKETKTVDVAAVSMSPDKGGDWHPMLAGQIDVATSIKDGKQFEINPEFIELGGRAYGMVKSGTEMVDGKKVDTYTKTHDYADLKYTSQVKLRNGDVLAALGGDEAVQSLYTIPVQQKVTADGKATKTVDVAAVSAMMDKHGVVNPMLAGQIDVGTFKTKDGKWFEINPDFIELGGRAYGMVKSGTEMVDGKTVDTYTKTNDYADLKYTSQVKLRNGDVLAALGGDEAVQSLYTIKVGQKVQADSKETGTKDVAAVSMMMDKHGVMNPMLAGQIDVGTFKTKDGKWFEINPDFIELGGKAWGMKKQGTTIVDGKVVDQYVKTNDYVDLKYTSQVKLRNGDVLAALGGDEAVQSLYTIKVGQKVKADSKETGTKDVAAVSMMMDKHGVMNPMLAGQIDVGTFKTKDGKWFEINPDFIELGGRA